MSADLTENTSVQNDQHARGQLYLARVLATACVLLLACSTKFTDENNATYPLVVDKRINLTLFAEHPDIVTPIGIAVDSGGMVYVLESHTHTPPKDYEGPDTDRIRIFSDADGNGKPEKNTVFAEGLSEGVNISFSPDGKLYVVTSRAVYAVLDRDGDLRADEKKEILVLDEPEKVYAHAALLGITFSADGWMYVSRGNTGSAFWKLRGSDGSTLSGYGDGGNVMRARPDGSGLEEVATGFWNPVDIKFNAHGQLFAADNDPDSRGPNRLVHVVPGGDYGYKSLYGGSGIHPYLAWNGELPGKLPFAAALGEAPSGLLDAGSTSLPSDYGGSMLATIWEESRVVRIDLKPHGRSQKGDASIIIEGGSDFRPVALAVGPEGEIYMTDWMLRKYPNHGRGRIWKISATVEQTHGENTSGDPAITKDIHQPPYEDGGESVMKRLASEDPFERHGAVVSLTHLGNEQDLVAAVADKNTRVRLGGMLAMQRSGYTVPASMMRKLLNDADEVIRMQALIWIGEEALTGYRNNIDDVLRHPNVSATLFKTYLETVKHLDPGFIESYTLRREPYAKSVPRELPSGFLASVIRDDTRSPYIRALAMKHIEDPREQGSLLSEVLSSDRHPTLRAEAVRLLASGVQGKMTNQLLTIALDLEEEPSLRADAVVALSRQPGDFVKEVGDLLLDSAEDVQLEAARYIRFKSSPSHELKIPEAALNATRRKTAIQEQLQIMSGNGKGLTPRPGTADEWARVLGSGGNSARGRRVFYSPQGMCSSCHAMGGTGGDLGPDLTKVALSKTRLHLLKATIDPSGEVSPEFQGWFIRLANGEEVRGRQIDIGEETIELYTHTSGFRSFSKKDVSDYGMIEASLMPQGLERNLTISEVRDLMAFLETSANKP